MTVVFLGGNGHAAGRLAPARAALDGTGVRLVDAPYPGFDGRPRAADFDAFLAPVAGSLERADLVYATGIGALVALALRARGVGVDVPLCVQGGVLWGLATRPFPRLLRALPGGAAAVRAAFALPPVRARFARRHFQRPLAPETRAAFFDGYARCAAFADLFAWLDPALLTELERAFAEAPSRLDGIQAWWGGRDTVVGLSELRATEAALGRTFPLRIFESWGHYPMLDTPLEWARALVAREDP